jgi:hypothetical protein
VDAFLGEHRAVHLDGREAFKGFGNGLVRDFPGFLERFALHELGCHTARRYGRPAAKGLELRVGDDVVLDL